MKETLRLFSIVIACATFAGLAFAANPPSDTAGDAQKVFNRFKDLVGTWHGEMHDGSAVELVYSLTGQGTSLIETFRKIEADDHDMLTVYHLDEDRLMLTHYCIAGNQPRMVAALKTDDSTIRFDFHDVTGRTEEGHMHHALIEIEGTDRMSQAWTFRKGGKDTFTEAIEYHRVR